MLNAHCEHQRSAATVLCNLAGRVAVSFHEGHQPRRSQGRIFHRGSLGTDVRQVMAYTTTALHQLNLLLVNLDDATIGVGLTIKTYDEAVAQRAHLEVVTDAGHRAALWHDVSEMPHELKDFLFTHGVGILLLNACNLTGDAVMHVIGREFVNVAIRVL